MSVWLTIPSKRPREQAEPVLRKWIAQGYKIALLVDSHTPAVTPHWSIITGVADCLLDTFTADYKGYAAATNELIAHVMKKDPDARWFVIGGDDVEPDPNRTADEIGEQCSHHFAMKNGFAGSLVSQFYFDALPEYHATLGVMQPTGDRWGDNRGAYIDRVCGSAWLGREFCTRVNQGNGPLWPEYFHMGVDEELQHIAIKYGILWQRPDLTHFHQHWGRTPPGKPLPTMDAMPQFLAEANSARRWNEYKAIFERRRAAGFPGSDLL